MKGIKSILLLIAHILTVPLGMMMVAGVVWFSLPELANTIIGTEVLLHLNQTAIF